MDSSQWFETQTRGRGWRSICAFTLTFVVMLVTSASAALPDLVSDPPSSPQLGVYADDGGAQRLLLRFDSYVHNAGAGPLEVRFPLAGPGGAADTAGAPEQVVEGELAPRPMPGAQVVFETGSLTNEDGHDHWHLQRAAAYELVLPGGAGTVAAEKVGFCLLDSLAVTAPLSSRHYTGECRRAPGATGPDTLTMGVSAGWRDLYVRTLAHQWVDVSNIAPGRYDLQARVDPDSLIAEEDEANPPAARPVLLPGYVARPRAGAQAVLLDGERFVTASGTLAPPALRIESAPAHGTVDKPIGTWFSDPVVRYTPADPSAPVPDEIEYVVRESGSAFPRTPPRAKATFGGSDRVAIGGAPATLVTGTSVQLSAVAPDAVAWSASAGSVTPAGVFTAPAVPGPVTVRAAVPGGAADAVTLDVVAPPVSAPAPLPSTAPAGDPAVAPPRPLAPIVPTALPRRAIEKAVAERSGRYVVVAVTPGRAGLVRVVLRSGGRTVRTCRVRGTAGRSVTCRLRRPASERGKLRVVVQVGKVTRAVPVRAGAHGH